MKQTKHFCLILITSLTINIVFAQKMMNEKAVMVGGVRMYASKNIVQNVMNSKDHTTLVAGLKAAGLVPFLQSSGPFTVFAPTNDAFSKLPKGTMEALMKADNKLKLADILSYHIVSGRFGTKELDAWIKDGKGTAKLRTISGGNLLVTKKDGKYWLKDGKAGTAQITINNVYQSNGVIHVIDHVVMPK